MTTYRNQRHRTDGVGHLAQLSTRCRDCDKVAFPSRKVARQRARQNDLHGLHVYVCPVGNGVHLGHQPESVRRGEVSSAAFTHRTRPRPHRHRKISAGVRTRSDEVFSPDTVTTFGADLSDADAVATWHAEYRSNLTWSQALAPYASDEVHPVHRLFDVPEGRNPQLWRTQAAALLMETLRDEQWITFDGRPGSLRSARHGPEAADRRPISRQR